MLSVSKWICIASSSRGLRPRRTVSVSGSAVRLQQEDEKQARACVVTEMNHIIQEKKNHVRFSNCWLVSVTITDTWGLPVYTFAVIFAPLYNLLRFCLYTALQISSLLNMQCSSFHCWLGWCSVCRARVAAFTLHTSSNGCPVWMKPSGLFISLCIRQQDVCLTKCSYEVFEKCGVFTRQGGCNKLCQQVAFWRKLDPALGWPIF